MNFLDPLICYEDLNNKSVLEVIEFFNRELDSYLGSDVKTHYDILLSYVKKPRVYRATLVRDGVVAAYRGVSEDVILIRDSGERVKLFSPPEGNIIVEVSRVRGSDSIVAIYTSIEGYDEGRVYLLDTSNGNIIHTIDGIISDVTLVGDRLVYTRSYRSVNPPDGREKPTDRLVELKGGVEKLLWGSNIVGAGESIDLRVSPDGRRAAVVVHRGWARSRLYIVDLESITEELIEGGDYMIRLVGWSNGLVYVRLKPSGDELVVNNRSLQFDSPLEFIEVGKDKLLIVDIVNARHRVSIMDTTSGNKTVIYEGSFTVLQTDSYNNRFLLVRTGLDIQYSIDVVEDNRVKVVDEGVKVDDVSISDFWVQNGDTKVHGFLATKRSKLKGVILYGYGGFGVNNTPKYSALFHHLMDLGYGIVIANIRGGREEGEEWHRMGMLKNKHNTFNDYASIARFFKSLGLKVIGYGISNGGLTVASVLVKWPELLDAAIIGYPVLDMIRYHKLYVGKYWISEYGDPEDPDMREYLLSYSPYHNIPRDKRLPPVLVYTGLHDNRVHPAHAIKFIVKARLLGHPVYLRVETRSGHSGAQVPIQALDAAYIISFIEKTMRGEG
ncbi:MAG: prolyl oligopeptidase family serine peptidase [Acidilobaceae archaeon]